MIANSLRLVVKQVLNNMFKISMKSFRLILVSLLMLLVFRLAGSQILSIKWLLDITKTIAGKLRLIVQKMSQLTFTHIS